MKKVYQNHDGEKSMLDRCCTSTLLPRHVSDKCFSRAIVFSSWSSCDCEKSRPVHRKTSCVCSKIKKLDVNEGRKDKLFADRVHRYAKRTIGWFCPSTSKCKDLWGQQQRDRGRALCTMCTCNKMWRGAHAHRASKLGLSNDTGIRMVNWEPQSKTPLKSRRRTH